MDKVEILELYEQNKQNYSVYFGYLILKSNLDQEIINLIFKHYQVWELLKKYPKFDIIQA